ncbi:17036_t:CDS:2, partial [Acaulospora morrowiae]
VTLNTPQNVQTGSTITISWNLTGTQDSNAELGIINVDTSASTTINASVDLSQRRETWVVTVDPGKYKCYIKNDDTMNTVYSDVFTIEYASLDDSNNSSSSSNTGTNIELVLAVLAFSLIGVTIILFAVFGMYKAKKEPHIFLIVYILAFVLPPLAVYISLNHRNRGKWVKVGLNSIGCLAYVPGVLHALYWVFMTFTVEETNETGN